MTRLPAIDRYTQRVVESGLACQECGTEFVKPHDEPVVCHFCHARLSSDAKAATTRAWHDEANRRAHEVEGRRRKSVKQARLERAQQENME